MVQPARRLAGLIRWPEDELGMWYIFVKHDELRQVQRARVMGDLLLDRGG